jgi:uncharacterized protein (TIGR03435 family)
LVLAETAAWIIFAAVWAHAAPPVFAVSAIRPSGPASENEMSIKFLPGGTLVARNATVRVLIKIAYNLNDEQLAGGPAWTAFKRFDIDAKPDSLVVGPNLTQQESQHHNQLLLQSLLNDRFHLKLRTETKDMSLYALVVAKGGLKLQKSTSSDSVAHVTARVGSIHATNVTMDDIARELDDKGAHPTENKTGLDGRYDFKLEWTPNSSSGPAPAPPASSDAGDFGPDLFRQCSSSWD